MKGKDQESDLKCKSSLKQGVGHIIICGVASSLEKNSFTKYLD